MRKDAAAAGYEGVENYIQAVHWSPPNLHDWVPDDLEATNARLEESCRQADRGELSTEEEVRSSMAEMKKAWVENRSAA